jgi:dipeptidyl aminopeptidase/acylaminoacyl peptidase
MRRRATRASAAAVAALSLLACSGGNSASGCTPIAVVTGQTALRQYDVLTIDAAGNLTLVTNDRLSSDAAVSPDGHHIVYTHGAPGSWSECCGYGDTTVRVREVKADDTETIVDRPDGWNDYTAAVSSDGSRMAFFREDTAHTRVRLVVSDLRGRDQHVVATVPGSGPLGGPAWSPDGKSIAAVARTRSGGYELMVFDASSGRVRQTLAVPWSPTLMWSPDGKRIVISSQGRQGQPVREITVGTGRVHEVPQPRQGLWTDAVYADGSGDRLLVLRLEEQGDYAPAQHLELIDRSGHVLHRSEVQVLPSADGGVVGVSNFHTSECFKANTK